mmetsp:Transcript_95348/g.294063  ORF Transcript_95348/g.294063 Transcript_95348/m.294063 type:complete len:282 (-) Transcript_95348:28-873(-)
MRSAKRYVSAKEVEVPIVLQHGAEVRVPKENRQLPLPHGLVQGEQPVVRELRGCPVHEFLYEQALLNGPRRFRILALPMRCSSRLASNGANLTAGSCEALLGLLQSNEPLHNLVVRQMRKGSPCLLLLLADNPTVVEDYVKEVEDREFLRVFEVRDASELAVHVQADIQSRQDLQARAQALLHIHRPGTGAVASHGRRVGVKEVVANHLHQLRKADVPGILRDRQLVTEEEDIAECQQRAGAVRTLQQDAPCRAEEADVLDAVGLGAVLVTRHCQRELVPI